MRRMHIATCLRDLYPSGIGELILHYLPLEEVPGASVYVSTKVHDFAWSPTRTLFLLYWDSVIYAYDQPTKYDRKRDLSAIFPPVSFDFRCMCVTYTHIYLLAKKGEKQNIFLFNYAFDSVPLPPGLSHLPTLRSIVSDGKDVYALPQGKKYALLIFNDTGEIIVRWRKQRNLFQALAVSPQGEIYLLNRHGIMFVYTRKRILLRKWYVHGKVPFWNKMATCTQYVYVLDEWGEKLRVYTHKGELVLTNPYNYVKNIAVSSYGDIITYDRTMRLPISFIDCI